MKPLHSETTRLSRCKCCQSKHSKHGASKTNSGKSAARQHQKRELRKFLEI